VGRFQRKLVTDWIGLGRVGATFDESGHSEVCEVREVADWHEISFSLVVWFSCDEQKDRLEGLFFSLDCTE